MVCLVFKVGEEDIQTPTQNGIICSNHFLQFFKFAYAVVAIDGAFLRKPVNW